MKSAIPAAAGLAALTILTRRSGRLARIDRAISDVVTHYRSPVGAPIARAVTLLGETPIAYPVLAVMLAVRGNGLRPLVVAGVAAALRRGLAEITGRPRPPSKRWLATAHGPSFPSRHTAAAALVAGLTAEAIAGNHATARAMAHGVGGAVAASRIWLGVHWASDVVGGWLYAIAWLDLTRRWRTTHTRTEPLS